MQMTAAMPIRGLCAPASLKPHVVLRGRESDIPYPGPLRPGLIEARLLVRTRFGTLEPIRGLCAPASLKRTLAQEQTSPCPIYPGPLRPGLIEAASLCFGGHRARCYPGPLRPGLIEARPSAGTFPTNRPPIRGLCAPASLKRGDDRAVISEHAVYPGPLRPGLIEANGPRRWSRSMSTIRGLCAPASLKRGRPAVLPSAATDYPGPLRPGLIEAGYTQIGMRIWNPPIRGLCAPASLKLPGCRWAVCRRALSGAFAPRPH